MKHYAVTLAMFSFVFLIPSQAWSDNGSAAVPFLELPFSARSSGMGEVGVVLFDENAMTDNPAAVAMSTADLGVFISFNPIGSEIEGGFAGDIKSNLWTVQFAVPGSAFSAGLYRNGISYGESVWTDESGALLEPFESHEEAYNLVVGVYWNRSVDVALGATCKYINSELAPFGAGLRPGDGSASTVAADFGALVRVPFQLPAARRMRSPEYSVWYTAVFGASVTNVGSDVQYGVRVEGDPLPTSFHGGISLEVAGVRTAGSRTWNQWSLVAAGELELELPGKNAKNYKIGVEAGIMEAVFARAGRLVLDRESEAIHTFGFSASLRGIIDLLTGRETPVTGEQRSIDKYLERHFDVRCNAAFYKDTDEFIRSGREVIGISVGLVP